MRPREIVGYRIREERTRLGMSQAQLAKIMTDLIGTKWFPQTVGAAEQGRRAFTVDDLIALSWVLGVDLNRLTLAPPGETIDIGPTPLVVPPDESPEDRFLAEVQRAVFGYQYSRNLPGVPTKARKKP